jgi:hypothetical protein
MISADSEKLYPAREAVERVINKRVHASTIHRWRLNGVQGIRLETVKVGGQRMCTLSAVRGFIDATNSLDLKKQRSFLPPEDVDQQLAARGI